MKKILLLGGSAQQIVAIETAKYLGLYTVLCDFLSDNPGQEYADKFYLVSTTDKEAVLEVAKKEKIDGVIAYASDPAAPTAAYVAEKLGLHTSPYKSVEILCNKDQFRDFLRKNGFNTPKAKGFGDIKTAIDAVINEEFRFPIIVKPVDSSGSKGVCQINNTEEVCAKIEYAMGFSRGGRIIIEEYVDKYGYQIAGDGLSIDGKLVFRCFANDHFDLSGGDQFVPISASFPYNMPSEVHDKVHDEIQRLLTLLNMGTTTYNFDIRIDEAFNVYLMEIAPRDGGNYIPDIIRYATGVDLVECSIKAAMGEVVQIPKDNNPHGYWAYYAVHSNSDGILDGIWISPEAEKLIVENHITKKKGDIVRAFTGANTTLGCLIMRFDSLKQMLYMMDHSDTWIKVNLDYA